MTGTASHGGTRAAHRGGGRCVGKFLLVAGPVRLSRPGRRRGSERAGASRAATAAGRKPLTVR